MKKLLLIVLAMAMMMSMLAGCAKQEEEKTSEPTAEQAQENEGMYVLYNGVKVSLGMTFADIADALGEQTKPEDVILPCGGGDQYRDVTHHYGNFHVTEDKNGIVKMLELSTYDDEPDSGAMVNGVVSSGMTTEEAIKLLGEPNNYPVPEDDYALIYGDEENSIVIFLNPDDNKATITGFNFIKNEPLE